MKGGKAPLGYTIIEVMIVLAISGLMFVIAANFVNGKQEKAAFTQGINDMATSIQDTIEQVTDGQYSDIPLNCLFDGTNTTFAGPTHNQGQDSNCVFLGKVMYFSKNGVASDYDTFSMAGGRLDTNNQPVTTLPAANPQVITDLTLAQTTPQLLDINNITVNGGGTQSFAFGFFQGQGTSDVAHSLQDGPQSLSAYYVSGVTSSMSESAALAKINDSANLAAAQQVDVCVTDGTRYADITLGTNNNQLSVNVTMYGTLQPPIKRSDSTVICT